MDCSRKYWPDDWPEVLEIAVPHYQQKNNWDCGIACLLMVLGEKERNILLENFDSIRGEEGFHKSIWTVDLAYLLKRFQVPHRYCTITVGVDPTYSSVKFYERVLDEDEQRINLKCHKAVTEGILEKSHQEMSDIIKWLSGNNVAIVLVDARFLECKVCKPVTQDITSCYAVTTWKKNVYATEILHGLTEFVKCPFELLKLRGQVMARTKI